MVSVVLYAQNESVWMNQNQFAEFFWYLCAKRVRDMANALKECELHSGSVIKNYLTTAADGKNYEIEKYLMT